MRILIAPDKYKGTLTAQEAAEAIAHGVRTACAKRNITPELDLCPLSDGGEGFLDIMAQATSARIEYIETTDPLGKAIRVPVGFVGDGYNEAIVESAQVIGLQLVPRDKRNPALLSTRGVGMILLDLVRKGCHTITIGLGGSATIDGGIGMAAALGDRFLDAQGKELPAVGDNLARIVCLEQRVMNLLDRTTIIAACDVNNPLVGEYGAARVYGPQKGAMPEQVERLEDGLANLARLAHTPEQAYTGAAGGLAFGLAVFAGASLQSGAVFALDAVRFAERAAVADLVITGEGSLDGQTSQEKVCSAVAQGARTPVIALPGRVALDADLSDFALVHPCAPIDAPHPCGRDEAADCLKRAAREGLLSLLQTHPRFRSFPTS